MKIAHIFVPDFPVQVETLEHPALEGAQVVIGGSPDQGGEVFACSFAARRAGIEISMGLRQAEQLAPGARFLPVLNEKYRSAHAGLIECLSAFSPLRQTFSLGKVILDASGLEGLYGPDHILVDRLCSEILERTGLRVQIGLAPNRFVSGIAARMALLGSGEVVGDAEAYLAPLPVEILPLSEEAQRLLTRLGLERVEQVAELPPEALSRVLGSEGGEIARLARGIDERPLIPEFEQTPLSAEINLDFELKHLPALVAYTDLLMGQLVRELGGYAAGAIILEFEQEDGRGRVAWGHVKPASGDRKRMSDRAQRLLEGVGFTAGVTGLKVSLVELRPAHEGARQIPFHHRYARTEDPLGRSLKTIRERYGKAAIQAAATLEGPPPEPVEVRLSGDGSPIALLQDRVWERIESVQLHWRVEGEWWWQEGRKDYYQVVTDRGEIRVLLRLSAEDRWYLHPAAKPTRWPVT